MKTQQNKILTGLALIYGLGLLTTLVHAEQADSDQTDQPVVVKRIESATAEPEAQAPETESVQDEVDAQTDDQTSEKRKEVLKEAVGAVAQTKEALHALEENKTDEALLAMETITGKLALIVARNPELAFAPVDVSVITHDLYASPETVRAQIVAAEEFLEDGAVQAARHALSLLASETRIQTTHIPLATYPKAIAEIAPLIDAGKVDEAKANLQLALNTLVVTEDVIPLPVLRATALLKAAEELANNDERTEKQNEELAGMLDAARTQVKLAQILGYGEKRKFKPILHEIKGIEEKTLGGKSGSGFFETLKQKLADF